ncbi:unnamed protein product, partial [Meganyctiphanes norvegica]
MFPALWMFPVLFMNSTMHIAEPDPPWGRERAMKQPTKMNTEELDMTNLATLTLLGILCLKSMGKESKYLKLKSWIRFLGKQIVKAFKKMYLLTLMTHIMQIITGLVLHALTLPLVIPFLLLFWFVSRIAKILIWLHYGSTASKCSGMDAAWGLESPQSRPIISVLITMSGIPDIGKIRSHIKSKIVDAMDPSGEYKYRKFHQLFFRRFGYYVWQDQAEFDITNHITMVSMKHSVGDKKSQILKYMCKTETMNLSGDRPPWRITVIDTGDGRYSLLIILHHAIGDGMSLVRLCLESLVDDPLTVTYPSPRKQHPVIKLFVNIWSAIVLPLGMLKVIGNNDKSSLHGVQLSGEKIAASSVGLPLELVRNVKKTAGATVNDVLMSCLASATTKLLARRNETCSNITTVIPVNFHQENEKLKLHNCFSCGIIKLSTEPTTSSLARLSDTKNAFDKLKVDPTLAAVYWAVAAASDIIPAPIAERIFTGKGISLAASNIP